MSILNQNIWNTNNSRQTNNRAIFESFNSMGRSYSNLTHEEKMITELKRLIIGYNTKIRTPIGTLCALYADHTATGRPFALIERHIFEDIKPMLANSHTETSEMGKFSTHLLKYAEEAILTAFNVSKKTHFAVPTAFGCTGALERLLKILNLEVDVSNGIARNPEMKKEDNPDIPVAFITPYEHHSNILPWVNAGCKVLVIDSDEMGNLDLEKFYSQLESHKHYRKIIVSVSAASNVTSQHTDLTELNVLIKRFRKGLSKTTRFYWIVDAAAYSSHGRLDLRGDLSLCDAVCLSPHKNLGGAEATGVLIMRLAAYDLEKNPSFPGGGTVSIVIGITEDKIFYDTEPAHREMPGTPNAVGFYRAALTFLLQDWIGIDLIAKKERENANYFYLKISDLNKKWQSDRNYSNRCIDIVGDQDISKRFGVFSFNIYGPGTMIMPNGRSCFHPHYVAKLLNDLFGIQARSGCACAGPFGVKLLQFTEESSKKMAEKILEGKEALKPGWCRLDTNFVFQQYEIDYIVKAIELIAMFGERILEFYVQDSSGQWSIPFSQEKTKYNFGMEGVLGEGNIEREYNLEERPMILMDQLERSKRIFEDPKQFWHQFKSDELFNHYKRIKMFKNISLEEEDILSQSVNQSERLDTMMPILDRRTSQLNNPIEETFNLVRGRNGSNTSQPATSSNNNHNNTHPNNNHTNNNQVCYTCCGGSSRKPNQCKEFSFETQSPFSHQRQQLAFPESTATGSNAQKECNLLKNCKTCNLSIPELSPFVGSGQNFFHTNCLKCGGCSKIMIDSHFIEDDEKICCFDCFNKVKCSVCNLDLREDYILSGKRGYHQECFSLKLNKTTPASEPKKTPTTLEGAGSRNWDVVYLLSFFAIFISLYKFHHDINFSV